MRKIFQDLFSIIYPKSTLNNVKIQFSSLINNFDNLTSEEIIERSEDLFLLRYVFDKTEYEMLLKKDFDLIKIILSNSKLNNSEKANQLMNKIKNIYNLLRF